MCLDTCIFRRFENAYISECLGYDVAHFLLRCISMLVFLEDLESLYMSMTESLDICIMCVLCINNYLVTKCMYLPYQLQNIFKRRFTLMLVVTIPQMSMRTLWCCIWDTTTQALCDSCIC